MASHELIRAIHLILIGAALLPLAAAELAPERTGPCPVATAKPCVIELSGPRAPSASAECAAKPWSRFIHFLQPEKWSDSNKDGWWETVVAIALDPAKDCGCAHVKVVYGGPSRVFSLNLGDSPTNDGFGGDAGTTFDSAEVQIQDNLLSVFSGEGPAGRRSRIQRLYTMELPPMAGRTVEFDICDQSLVFALTAGPGPAALPITWTLQTLNTGLLFSLAPRTHSEEAGARAAQDHAIYAAFNRVIHTVDGKPSRDRFGSGVRRVELTLTP